MKTGAKTFYVTLICTLFCIGNPLISIADSDSLYVSDTGNVGIGTTSPATRLQVLEGTDISLSGGGFIVSGSLTSINIGIDDNEIMARDNGSPSTLHLQANGGDTNVGGNAHVIGSVGIGTASPETKLQVRGGTDVSLSGGGFIVSGSLTSYNMGIDENEIMARNNGSPSTLHLQFNGGDTYFGGNAHVIGSVGIGTAVPKSKFSVSERNGDMVNVYSPADNTLAVQTSLDNQPIGTYGGDGQNRLVLQPTVGNVGIGTATPQYKLDVNGDIRGNNLVPSDIRWKENIESLENALDIVTQLRGVSYDWIDTSRGAGRQIGVIAQEVEQVLPEVVHTDSQGYKSVEYAKIVAPLIEAIKALKKQNEDLEKRLKAIETKLSE